MPNNTASNLIISEPQKLDCEIAIARPSCNSAIGRLVLLVGIGVLLSSIALTAFTYMPCPFWDEWDVVASIAKGQGPWSWTWLWSQHNEHRIVIPRVLIWLDIAVFGGKNISLFAELYVAQILHWIAISITIEHFTALPTSLKRTLQGLFAIFLFHPNQVQNFTWAFQVSFVLPFDVGTTALLGISFIEELKKKRMLALIWAGVAPIIAGFNLSGGLVIGPIIVYLGCVKRLRRNEALWLLTASAASILLYLKGYRSPDPKHSPLQAIFAPLDLLMYVLTYVDASWMLVPHPFRAFAVVSILCLIGLAVWMIHNRDKTTDFEWFCLAECLWILATATLTGMGRLQFGIEQAVSSRYQTPAMLYWASFFALALVTISRQWPSFLGKAQQFVTIAILCSLGPLPVWWSAASLDAVGRLRACSYVQNGNYYDPSAQLLYPRPHSGVLERAARFLYRSPSSY